MAKIATAGEGWYLTEEEWLLKQNLRELVEKEISPRFKENYTEETADKFYKEAMRKLGEAGFLRVGVAEELGGLGMRLTALLIVTEEVTRGNGALGIHAMENQLLGSTMAVAAPKAWERWGEGIMDGTYIYGASITQPEGNGNMCAWKPIGVQQEDGSWILNGEKAFGSGLTFADVFTITGLGLTNQGEVKMCKWNFSTEEEHPGLTIHHNPEVGCSPTYASLTMKDVYVPAEYGGFSPAPGSPEDAQAGAIGYKAFAVCCAALAMGTMSAAWDKTVEYLSNRESWGKKVIEYGAIQAKLVDMKCRMEAARSMMYTAARMIETLHKDAPAWADMTKIFVCDTARQITDECVQMHGAVGINPDSGIARHHLDAMCFGVGVGTSDLHYPCAAEELGFPKSDDLNRT